MKLRFLFASAAFLSLPVLTISRPYITYAALGDSYPTGNGAGRPTDIGCGVFTDAYPWKVARQLVLAVKNLACAGSFVGTVLRTQVPWVDGSDVVTIQIGGNEANFFALLNECVRQWKPVSTCEREVARALGIIESDSFIRRYDNLVLQTKKQMKPDGILLVLGYATFFNDKTEQCNHVTFSNTDPQNLLTREKRRLYNDIVSKLNGVAAAVAETHNAIYVDIDQVLEGHRFCEDGVLEPAPDASWFFNDIRVGPDVLPMALEQAILTDSASGFINLTRTFHPTSEGHAAIADKLVQTLRKL